MTREQLPPADPVPPRGLPDHLPNGEKLVWQGSPAFRQLAVTAFHIRKVAIYFALLLALRIAFGIADGGGPVAVVVGAVPLAVLAAMGLAVIAVLAWLSARTTVYTITSKRLVLHCGIALPMTINIPFTLIAAADLKVGAAGTGDVSVTLPADKRIAYLQLWPHARPWHMKRPQPTLRSVPEAAKVAELLALALAAVTGGSTAGLRALQRPGTRKPNADLPSGVGIAAE